MVLSPVQWLALTCVLGMCVGQIMFKVSALSLNGTESIFAPKTFLLLAATMLFYVVVSFGWVLILRKSHLGQVFPFYSLAFVLVPVASYFLFGERFSISFILGSVLIIAGLRLCMRST